MIHNYSPWIEQIKRTRPVISLDKDASAEIAIIGGGIAGITTAYFILQNTARTVILIEADKIAHGATGHNAGQLVSYFEKPFHEIVSEFGLKMAAEGLNLVQSAWELLDEIYLEAGIKTPLTKFTGYAGCTSFEQIIPHLRNNALRKEAGLPPNPVYVSEESDPENNIPAEYRDFYKALPARSIQDLLETDDRTFIGALESLKGCLNSAAFTEELANHLAERYKDRFMLVEQTPVKILELHQKNAELITPKANITADQVILCTNGFEYIHIENKHGPDIDTKFHHMIKGSIGYMAAYLDPQEKPPSAISYFPLNTSDQHTDAFEADPYFYLTRRLYYTEDGQNPNLVCIGGPEQLVDDTTVYSKQHPYPEKAKKDIDSFINKTYRHAPKGKESHAFLWHGLMGYTPNGIRRVGFEPCNPVLMYNLGCNGVGILPSIYGSKRISQIIAGQELEPSIFDPHDQRCEITK